ncbi:uncharacterized protein LOC131658444 [Vicia villosa]|uniref:uncharacterized protein LOC131658444 n=1 Tax=Vicia villosa TaxID=3911 RepID=UPI00273A8176|nr:uncharacterized protein LOC131658444 [Vicia villosa]
MGCERGGNYKKKNYSDGSYSMKVKCPFMLRSVPSGSSLKVKVRCGFHNHILVKDLYGHGVLGRLKENERQFVNDMIKYNMVPRYIIAALKYRDPKNLTSVIQVYIARYTYKTNKRVKLLIMFHLVLIFDCTYKTNRYLLPLLDIVGVTSTKLTFSVGFSYMEHKRKRNFTWALDKLKTLFAFECCYIDEIIDVDKYGNCGLCAIVALLGWGKEAWLLVRM